MLAELTSKQIAEWHAYFCLEPFGWKEDWRRAGVIAATIANVNRGRGSREFRETDFMPSDVLYKPDVKKQSAEEQAAVAMSVFAPFMKKQPVETDGKGKE